MSAVSDRAKEAKPARNENGGRPRKGEKPISDIGFLPYAGAKRLTARIARDRPDILERMKQGEYHIAADWVFPN